MGPGIRLSVEGNAMLAVVGAVILVLGLVSGHIKSRYWVSEPLVCLVVGMLCGPLVLGLLDIDMQREGSIWLVHQLARVTLAISIMGVALRLPAGYVLRHWKEVAVVLGIVMPAMWISTTAISLLLLPLSFLVAALLAAVVTPTDPVLADSIVTGSVAEKSVPSRVRNLITAESGANDGLGLLFVLLPFSLLTRPPAEAIRHWVTTTLVWEIVVGTMIGIVLGWVAARCLDWSYEQAEYEPVSVLGSGIALSLAVLGFVDLIGGDGLLAVFAGGVVFARVVKQHEDQRHERIQEAVGRFFDLPIFVLFGALLPWSEWRDLGWAGLAFAPLALLLRRLPIWLVLYRRMPSLRHARDGLFVGWFGPVGIAALFYVTGVEDRALMHEIWPHVSLVIFLSVLIHGTTATPLTHLYRRRSNRVADRPVVSVE
jgi:NhaP-type Na+/H+ or K+/H+ antiporter